MATFNPLTGVSFDDTMEIPTYEEMMKPYESYKAQYDKDEAAAVETQAAMAQYLPYIGTEGEAYDAYQKMQNRINRYSSYIGTPAYMLHRDEYMKLAKDYAEQNAMFKNALEGYNQSEKEVRALMAKDPTNFTRLYHIDENGNVAYDDNHTLNNHWGNKQVYAASVSGTDVMNLGKETGQSFSRRSEEVKGYGGIKKALNEYGQIVAFQSRSSREGVPNVITIDMIMNPDAHKEEWAAFEANDHVGQYSWWIKNLKNGELGEQMRRDLMQSKDNNGVSAFDKMTQKDQKALIEKYLAGVYKGLDYKEDNQYQEQGHTPPDDGKKKENVQQIPNVSTTDEGTSHDGEEDKKNLTEDANGNLSSDIKVQAENHVNSPEIEEVVQKTKDEMIAKGEMVNKLDFSRAIKESDNIDALGVKIKTNGAIMYYPLSMLAKEAGINIKDYMEFSVISNEDKPNYSKLYDKIKDKIKDGSITDDMINNVYSLYSNGISSEKVKDATDDIYKKNGWKGSLKKDRKIIENEQKELDERVKTTENLPGSTQLEKARNGQLYKNATNSIKSVGINVNTPYEHDTGDELSKVVGENLGSSLNMWLDKNDDWINKTMDKALYGVFEYSKDLNGSIHKNQSKIKAVDAKDAKEALEKINRFRIVDGYIVFDVKGSTNEFIVKPNDDKIRHQLGVIQQVNQFFMNDLNKAKSIGSMSIENLTNFDMLAKEDNQQILSELATRATKIGEENKTTIYAACISISNTNDSYYITFYKAEDNKYHYAIGDSFSDISVNKGDEYKAQYSLFVGAALIRMLPQDLKLKKLEM